MTVVDFLKHGRENAIRADVLAAAMGTTPRGLRSQIMKARDAGEIILYVTSCQAMIRRLHNGNCPRSITPKPPAASMVSLRLRRWLVSWVFRWGRWVLIMRGCSDGTP